MTNPEGNYTVKLDECKNAVFVFNSGLVSGTGDSTLDGKPFVSIFASGPDTTTTPMIERLDLDYPVVTQNKIKLQYTDVFPFLTSNLTEMHYCKQDPRGGADPEFDFDTSGPDKSTVSYGQSSILPDATTDPNPKTGSQHTSCLISTTEFVTAGGAKKYRAFIYSMIDGLRVGTG